MQKEYRVGIEFEYWLTQYRNKSAAGIKSFDNITLSELAPALNNRPGMDDASLHKGDAGIKAYGMHRKNILCKWWKHLH